MLLEAFSILLVWVEDRLVLGYLAMTGSVGRNLLTFSCSLTQVEILSRVARLGVSILA